MPLSRKQWRDLRNERRVAEALAFDTVRVQYLPTIHKLHCKRCQHQGRVAVPHGKPAPRFRCSRCGYRAF